MMEGDGIKIAICDDDKQELLFINKIVNEYKSSNTVHCRIDNCMYSSSTTLITELENGKHFDVYLLDIMMPEINGIELAAKIRRNDQAAKIIFLTSSPEYAVDSYCVGAFNYLLKPIGQDKLFAVLKKACDDNYSDVKQYIITKTQTNLTKIFLHELCFVEAIGRTLCFHQKNGVTTESICKLSQVKSDLLIDKRFIKPHRSYIVNLDYIKSLSPEGFTMTSGHYIPISRNVYREVKQAYINHCF